MLPLLSRRRSGKRRRGWSQYWPHRRLPGRVDDRYCYYRVRLRKSHRVWLSQFVGLVSSEEHQLVIHDSVAGCIYTNCNINKEHRKEGDAFGTELCLFN
jgi:hypothetical protein